MWRLGLLGITDDYFGKGQKLNGIATFNASSIWLPDLPRQYARRQRAPV